VLRFACPKCSTILEAPDAKAGHKIACPKCRQRLQIPPPLRDKTILATPLPPRTKGQAPEPASASPQKLPRQSAKARKGGRVPQPSRPHRQAVETVRVPIGDCPRCQKPVAVHPEALGRWIGCPHCGEGFAASAKEALALAPRPHEGASGKPSAGRKDAQRRGGDASRGRRRHRRPIPSRDDPKSSKGALTRSSHAWPVILVSLFAGGFGLVFLIVVAAWLAHWSANPADPKSVGKEVTVIARWTSSHPSTQMPY
jgi:DNA-directed RNA polymerase subunit RPC12/RpoP